MTVPIPVGPEAAMALAELHAAAFDRPWSAAAFASMLGTEGAIALAAGTASHPDAFILIRSVAGESEILALAVRPDARRRGLGRSLVEAGARAAVQLGAQVLFLEVAVDNAPALALYRAAGFAPSATRRGYYPRADGPPADALTLWRGL